MICRQNSHGFVALSSEDDRKTLEMRESGNKKLEQNTWEMWVPEKSEFLERKMTLTNETLNSYHMLY